MIIDIHAYLLISLNNNTTLNYTELLASHGCKDWHGNTGEKGILFFFLVFKLIFRLEYIQHHVLPT